jgi:hypothetical protein
MNGNKSIAIGVAGLLVGLVLGGLVHHELGIAEAEAPTPATAEAAIASVYPLYTHHITFGEQVRLSVPPKTGTNPTDNTISGYLITSDSTATTTDISSISEPFRMFYDKKLIKKGWSINPKFQADGPGASIWGFTKGKEVVIFAFTTTFLGTKPNQPVECPCTLVFTILGGLLQ